MNWCSRCTLIYDDDVPRQPDTEICILCAADLDRRSRRAQGTDMDIITTTKTIKVHTLRIDDSEIERFMDNPEEWNDVLSTLLTAKPAPNGNTPPKKKHGKKSAARNAEVEKIDCPKCGMPVKPKGLLRHQRGSKCRARAGIDQFSAD